MTSWETGFLIFSAVASGLTVVAFLLTFRALRRAQREAEDMTDEIVMLFRDGLADRVPSRLSEFGGPFWLGAKGALEVDLHPGDKTLDSEGLGKRHAQLVGQPWGVLVLLMAVGSTLVLASGGCLLPFTPGDSPHSVRFMRLWGVGPALLAAVLSSVALGEIRRQCALLAGTFAPLLDRILEAARSSRGASPPPPPPSN